MYIGHQPWFWYLLRTLITGVDLFHGELNTPFNLQPPRFFLQPEPTGACLGYREGAGLIYGLDNLPGEREGASDPGVNHGLPPGPVSFPGKEPGAFVISMFPLRG